MLMSILLADTPVKGGGVTNFFRSGDISLLGVKKFLDQNLPLANFWLFRRQTYLMDTERRRGSTPFALPVHFRKNYSQS